MRGYGNISRIWSHECSGAKSNSVVAFVELANLESPQSWQRRVDYEHRGLLRGQYLPVTVPRHLGIIRFACSLLLLSDFHPRSMHFPPNDDDEDILAPDEEGLRGLSSAENDAVPPGSESTFAGWTEPAVRSDRMSWSLIGFAHALAYELGIFGTYADGVVSVDGRVKRQGGPLMHHKRADRLERLLYIYMTQACGRFGFPSMYPDHITAYNLASMRDGFTSGQPL